MSGGGGSGTPDKNQLRLQFGELNSDSKKYYDLRKREYTDKESNWTVDAFDYSPGQFTNPNSGMNADFWQARPGNYSTMLDNELFDLIDNFHPWEDPREDFEPIEFFPKDRTFFGEEEGETPTPSPGGGLPAIPTPRLRGPGGIPSLGANPVNTGLIGGPTPVGRGGGMFNDGGVVANSGYGNGGYAAGTQFTQPIAPPNGPPGGQFNPIAQAPTPPTGAQSAGGAGNWSNPTMFSTGFADGGEVKLPPTVRGYTKKPAEYMGGNREKVTYQSEMAKKAQNDDSFAGNAPAPPPLLGAPSPNWMNSNFAGNNNMYTNYNPGGFGNFGIGGLAPTPRPVRPPPIDQDPPVPERIGLPPKPNPQPYPHPRPVPERIGLPPKPPQPGELGRTPVIRGPKPGELGRTPVIRGPDPDTLGRTPVIRGPDPDAIVDRPYGTGGLQPRPAPPVRNNPIARRPQPRPTPAPTPAGRSGWKPSPMSGGIGAFNKSGMFG